MKHKLILLALVFSLVIVSQNSFSLGMGKIQVNSALNESLNANINIIANENEPIEQVSVKLASAADYKKVGLDKSFVPSNIMVSMDSNNPYQVNVSSNGPVSEPIVTLLLDVTWPNGRILREFTLLLDPPSYQSGISGLVSVPVAKEDPVDKLPDDAITVQNDDIPPVSQDLNQTYEALDTEEPVAVQESTELKSESLDENVSETVSTLPGEVYVAAGDTLWRIANQNKPADVTTHQMMMSIYEKNENAFLNNNINQMIKGSTLQMPDASEVDDMSHSDAFAAFESHNNRWVADTDSYRSFQTETQSDTEDVVSDDVDYGVQLSGGAGDETDSQQTEGDIADSGNSGFEEEDAYNSTSENQELRTRVSELENIVDEQQAALVLQDDDMANLENQMEQTDDLADESVVDDGEAVDDLEDSAQTDDVWGTDVTEGDEDLDSLFETDNEEEAGLSEVSDSEDFNMDDTAAVEETTTVEQAEEDETDSASQDILTETPENPVVQVSDPWYTSGINWIMENVLWVIIGLVVLFLIVLLPRLFNRDDEDVSEENSFLDDIKSTRSERKKLSETDATELDEDEETVISTPVSIDDEDESEDSTLEEDSGTEDDSDADDDVLADLDNSLSFDDNDEADDDDDDFEFDFDDDEEDEDMSLDQDDSSDQKEQEDDEIETDLDDDLDNETPTKEYDPTPFKDDAFDEDFDLSELDETDEIEMDSTEDEADKIDEDSSIDESDEKDLNKVESDLPSDEDVLDLEAELSDFEEDEADDSPADSSEKPDEDEDASDEDLSDEDIDDEDDFSDELDDLDDLIDLDDLDIDEEQVDTAGGVEAEESQDADEETTADFEDELSLDEEDKTTAFETEEDDMDDDSVDLGLDDLMDDSDVIETKLDLAKAYIEMGDTEGAKNLLDEVKSEGSEAQQSEANKLLDDM